MDLLVIDAEMFDYTLLRSINMRAIGPLAIEFESKTMSVQQGREIAALSRVARVFVSLRARWDLGREALVESHENCTRLGQPESLGVSVLSNGLSLLCTINALHAAPHRTYARDKFER